MNQFQFQRVSILNSDHEPHPRSGHRAFSTESDLWIWGGYHPHTSDNQIHCLFFELWRFNFSRKQWTQEKTTGEAPDAPASPALCHRGNSVFVFGGTKHPFGEYVSNGLFVLNLKTRHWQKLNLTGDEIRPVFGASILVNEQHLYILCGVDPFGLYNTNVYDVDLKSLISTQIGNTFLEVDHVAEAGRYRQEAHLYDNHIYLFGGGGAFGHSYSLNHIPVFDLSTNQWTIIKGNPDPIERCPIRRRFHSVLPFDDSRVILFGGARFDHLIEENIPVDRYVWLFDLRNHQWTRINTFTLPYKIYFHASTKNKNGEIYVHGGVIRESDFDSTERRTTTIHRLQTRVLSLGDIAWNFLLENLVDRRRISEQNTLAQLSIPVKFIKRVDLNLCAFK